MWLIVGQSRERVRSCAQLFRCLQSNRMRARARLSVRAFPTASPIQSNTICEPCMSGKATTTKMNDEKKNRDRANEIDAVAVVVVVVVLM